MTSIVTHPASIASGQSRSPNSNTTAIFCGILSSKLIGEKERFHVKTNRQIILRWWQSACKVMLQISVRHRPWLLLSIVPVRHGFTGAAVGEHLSLLWLKRASQTFASRDGWTIEGPRHVVHQCQCQCRLRLHRTRLVSVLAKSHSATRRLESHQCDICMCMYVQHGRAASDKSSHCACWKFDLMKRCVVLWQKVWCCIDHHTQIEATFLFVTPDLS